MRSRGYVGESLKSGKFLAKWKGANNRKALSADSGYGSAVFIAMHAGLHVCVCVICDIITGHRT